MAEYQESIERTLIHEGGYVHDIHDSGGETYKGISRVHHKDWFGWERIDQLKKLEGFPDSLDEDGALHESAVHLYRDKYWLAIKGDEIDSQKVAQSVFDFAVNAGVRTASRILQVSVGAEVDGIIGPNTIKRVNLFNEDILLVTLDMVKIRHYHKICRLNKKNCRFFFGWVTRVLGE